MSAVHGGELRRDDAPEMPMVPPTLRSEQFPVREASSVSPSGRCGVSSLSARRGWNEA